jgi:hypothetical protein
VLLRFLVCACVVLAGCGPREFVKVGISDTQRDHDSAECWDYALNSPEGQRKSRNIKIAQAAGAAIAAGPVALATVLVVNAAKRYKPKEHSANIQVHRKCMYDKGYTLEKKS